MKPVVNSLYPTADSLDDAMNRAKASLYGCSPNEVHAAVMCYHNTLIKELLKGGVNVEAYKITGLRDITHE